MGIDSSSARFATAANGPLADGGYRVYVVGTMPNADGAATGMFANGVGPDGGYGPVIPILGDRWRAGIVAQADPDVAVALCAVLGLAGAHPIAVLVLLVLLAHAPA
jgi:hypothetical protein